ncbi:hypothetical protein CHY_2438 [Carboxydothermus hydrogenoformans Z-2901]|uniref:Uncharacterized protein n=1 Tax=Carboxydothermus hydrogenoformans (strain ATCC BAA-161 / DSM 6008 / Z-2901) TaxID=246194 RepID=Q3A9F2_CARHZ|nr:hypothetical protein CHY_2438 [Carboxydothermus hydrogenoformans Z-2901]
MFLFFKQKNKNFQKIILLSLYFFGKFAYNKFK